MSAIPCSSVSMQPTFSGEIQLAGWSESHTGGCKVTFWLQSTEDLDAFRALTVRKGNTAGHRFMAALVEIGDDEQPIGLSEFLDKALLNRVNVHMLAPLAELHKPRSVFKLHTPPSADVRVSLLGADALVRHIWKNGPSGKFDRSNTLVRLAYKCKDCGMSAEDAYVVVTDADKRWGKFHLRPDVEEHIAKIIARAYSEEQS